MKTLGIPEENAAELYAMLLRQKMYYAPLADVRETLVKHAQSRYDCIRMGSPLGIFLRSRKTQLRHRLAVTVKSSRLYQSCKAGEHK